MATRSDKFVWCWVAGCAIATVVLLMSGCNSQRRMAKMEVENSMLRVAMASRSEEMVDAFRDSSISNQLIADAVTVQGETQQAIADRIENNIASLVGAGITPAAAIGGTWWAVDSRRRRKERNGGSEAS